MKIPYRDSRNGLKTRWTDHESMVKHRFVELRETLEACNEIRKEEWFKLRELVEKKIQAFTSW